MKKLIYILIIAIATYSCEEVIEIDLNSTKPHLIIEGTIFPDESPKVIISETTDYFKPGEPDYINDAFVQIVDNEGNYAVLTNQGQGLYTDSGYVGKIGSEYSLNVTIENESYTAKSKINEINELDSIEITKMETPMQEERFMIQVHLNNDVDKEKYTRVRVIKNNENLNEYFVSQTSIIPLRYPEFIKNDTLEIHVLTLDKPTYYYYLTLADIVGEFGMPTSSPANPVTNWDKDILGYFGAMSVEKRFIILQ